MGEILKIMIDLFISLLIIPFNVNACFLIKIVGNIVRYTHCVLAS